MPLSLGPSIRLNVRLFPLYLRNRLTVDLESLHVTTVHGHGSQGIEGQGGGSDCTRSENYFCKLCWVGFPEMDPRPTLLYNPLPRPHRLRRFTILSETGENAVSFFVSVLQETRLRSKSCGYFETK